MPQCLDPKIVLIYRPHPVFFFDFLSRFLRIWLQGLQKVTLKIFLDKKSKKISKNAEFHADFESVEKVGTKCTKKVTSKTSLTYMSKSEKSAYFCLC
jgi:hypothetical protein